MIPKTLQQERDDTLEEVARMFDGCSCPEPCDEYFGYIGVQCPKGIAASIRRMKSSSLPQHRQSEDK